MTLHGNVQFCSNMLLQVFIALYLLTFGTLIVECRTDYIDRKHIKDVIVECNKTLKYDEQIGVKICNDREMKKVHSMDNDTRFLDGDEINEVDEGRKKKNNKGYGRILLYMIGAAKATILYITLHAVAVIAAKALIVAKVALAVATAIALKKGSEHSDKTSYEIVKHPHHSYIQTHSSSIDYDHHGGYESGYGHRKRRRVFQR
ncbi:PREDICTED: uncharacterized protein LOC106784612 [Polistes canadensis]|uniref:uncharacterized protein LOC106784612 n=1 Tax=Polistes canadensis TaxID=91411 RepID=UPI000718D5E2|nr:PREDICTED: uncharacterized protein LOC106784612 [Polistes canadensis]